MKRIFLSGVGLFALSSSAALAGFTSVQVGPQTSGSNDLAAILALIVITAVVAGPSIFKGGKNRAEKAQKTDAVEGKKKSKVLMKF